MSRRRKIPVGVFIVLFACGCYPNRATIDPWGYAPSSPSTTWTPPQDVKKMQLLDEEGELPVQDDPYSLAEIIDIALGNNQQTKVTWAQARSAAASYAKSQSPYFPSISGGFSYMRARQPAFVSHIPGGNTSLGGPALDPDSGVKLFDVYYSLWGPQLSLSYLIYDFGMTRATSEAAKQALYSADWTHNSAILTVLQTVMTDYYNYLYQQELLKADEANIETAELTLSAANTGFQTGVRNVSDVLQAKTQLLQQQTSWATQKQNVENSYTELLTDMGVSADREIKTLPLPKQIPSSKIIPPRDTLIAVALQNRPDLLAMEATVKSNQQTLLAAKKQLYPQFNYNFELGKNYYNKGMHDRYNFTSTFAVSMPLFKGFYYRNEIKIAEANKKEAEEKLKQTELNVIQQVTNYHYSVETSFETVQFARQFLKAAKQQYQVALAQYKEGVNTILDVVSAQSSLIDARAQLVKGLDSWYTSLANLAYSTGMLSPQELSPFENNYQVDIAKEKGIPNERVAKSLEIFNRLKR